MCPETSTGRLYDDSAAMRVLTNHLKVREGVVPHFYCDSKDYVTIGVGCLVDIDSNDLARRERSGSGKAKGLVTDWGVTFRRRSDGQRPSLEEVAEDWHRVFKSGKGKTGSAAITKLRMDPGHAESLATKQAKYFCGGMYRKKPFARQLHSWIQMALIDARWNPSGVNPWHSFKRDIVEMWSPSRSLKAQLRPGGAQQCFAAAYKGRGGDLKVQYGERHAWRNDRFLEGAMRMIA